ncbi:MAG: hypothetical protein P1Q69_05590 [Candidatus Thorarchaeota archaeon]|nr:hypothetical protein [Candidatus Thorarchaeota archaeon]
MPWDIENYHFVDGRILNVEISIPLLEFIYTNIDDVKEAWEEMLGQFMSEQNGLELSWEMQPRDKDALVTIKIAKPGDIAKFTESETKGALGAVDAMYDKKQSSKSKKSKPKAAEKTKPKPKSKAKPKSEAGAKKK